MKSTHVTVTTTATLLADQGGAQAKLQALVQNVGGQTVYVGGSDVTTGNGYELPAGGEDSFELGANDKLYGVVAAGTCVVEVAVGGS